MQKHYERTVGPKYCPILDVRRKAIEVVFRLAGICDEILLLQAKWC